MANLTEFGSCSRCNKAVEGGLVDGDEVVCRRCLEREHCKTRRGTGWIWFALSNTGKALCPECTKREAAGSYGDFPEQV